ncbi:hypothetical protein BMY_1502 [Wohlfahrtiimonas chitiniclastica]|nr:hypothetical protein [Wohlfahrtiimonas chitiniclastica]KZS23635.1 hypothetical protein BMY_1502 [Wohlfahrtiimonas chitiniclastica]
MKINIISLFLSLIFGYFTLYNVKVIIVAIVFLLINSFLNLFKFSFISVRRSPSFLIGLCILIYTALLAIYSGNYKSIGSTFTFFLLAYWPIFYISNQIRNLYKQAYYTYLLAAIITSFGVILQMLLYKLTNTHLGFIQQFGGGRIAYGFIWNDYSFLSLFLVSAVPLVLSLKGAQYKYVLTLILISASLITSARTGITSLTATYLIYTIFKYPYLIKKKKTYQIVFYLYCYAL